MKIITQESIRFFNIVDLPYVQSVYGANVTNEFPRHIHNGISVGIILKGERVIEKLRTTTIIPEKGVFLINPGKPHACRARNKNHSYFTINIDSEYLKAIASQISKKASIVPYFTNVLHHDSDLRFHILQFFSLAETIHSSLEKESVLYSLLSTLILRYGKDMAPLCQPRTHTDAINRTCEYIKTHYAENITLKQLAKIACLSPFYFQRLFLRHAGVSPYNYLLNLRIKKARELLAQGQNIARVALDTGFVDQSHFHRLFKRIIGTTPGRYLQLS